MNRGHFRESKVRSQNRFLPFATNYNPKGTMMKDPTLAKTYDSVEYGLLIPEVLVVPERDLRKKRMSCGKCLCITVLVLVSLFLVTSLMASAGAYFWMKHQVRRFTTDKPVSYPIHELPEEDLEIVVDRAKLFFDSVKAGVPAEDLVVTEEEMNGFIAHSDYLRGNAVVHLTENKFAADMSLPAKGFPGGKGRFFVTSGYVSSEPTNEDKTLVTMELKTPYEIEHLKYPTLLFGEFLAYMANDGTQTVNVRTAQFYNWKAPEDYIEKKENILDHICDDEDMDDKDCQELRDLLHGIESITIADKKITFRARSVDKEGDNEGRRLSKSSTVDKKSHGHYVRRALKRMLA